MKLIYLILILIIGFSTPAFSSTKKEMWSKDEREAYLNRRFILLEHLLVSHEKHRWLDDIQAQDRDLSGCRSLSHGKGGLGSALQCMAFINREEDLKLKSPGLEKLTTDINTLCRKLISRPEDIEKILRSRVLAKKRKNWAGCLEAAWRQVYLTAYANFDADPVGTLSLVRQTRQSMAGHSGWLAKTLEFIKSN